jgi:inorganic pyrophosphatase
MTNLLKLAPYTDEDQLRVVVETPRGSEAKMNYDPKIQAFTLKKSLLLGLRYPFDWGFVPSTLAEDGDPMDVMVIHQAKTYPGVVLTCALIGILEVTQKEGKKVERNDRLMAVPFGSHREDSLNDARKLPARMREELEKFFTASDAMEDKELEFQGWKGPADAKRRLDQAIKRYRKNG